MDSSRLPKQPLTQLWLGAALGPRTVGNPWSAADNTGKRTPSSARCRPIAAGPTDGLPALVRQRFGPAVLTRVVPRVGKETGNLRHDWSPVIAGRRARRNQRKGGAG